MAPIPEDNKDISSSRDDSDHFFNPDLTIPVGESDSDNSDDGEGNFGAPGGYSLLPQEPDENGFDSDDSYGYSTENIANTSHVASFQSETSAGLGDSAVNTLAESVLSTEEGAVAPTVLASNNTCHPLFIAKFPSGKIPSYMQVPRVPREKDEHLWNQQRQEPRKATLDQVHESKILKAMSRFSLPTENIPDWARDLSDDQWQQQIVSRIGFISDKGEHSMHARPLTPPTSSEDSTDTIAAAVIADDSWVAEFADDTNSTDTN